MERQDIVQSHRISPPGKQGEGVGGEAKKRDKRRGKTLVFLRPPRENDQPGGNRKTDGEGDEVRGSEGGH